MRFIMGCFCFLFGLPIASPLVAQQSQFQGSVPTGVPSSTPLALTLREAIDRGLKTNLGLLISEHMDLPTRCARCGSGHYWFDASLWKWEHTHPG